MSISSRLLSRLLRYLSSVSMMFSGAKAATGTLWKGTPGLVSSMRRCSKVFSLISLRY